MCCNTAEHGNEQMKEKVWIGLRLWIRDRKGAASFTVCVCVCSHVRMVGGLS